MNIHRVAEQQKCAFCGSTPSHPPEFCHAVRAIEYYRNGEIRRVEKYERERKA